MQLTFVDARGNETHLARHLILSALGRKAFDRCLPLQRLFGVHCVEDHLADRGRDFDSDTSSFGFMGLPWQLGTRGVSHSRLGCSITSTSELVCHSYSSSSGLLSDPNPAATKAKIDFFAAGFTKLKLVLDALSLGPDVLFLDVDQVFFKNPIPYILQVVEL